MDRSEDGGITHILGLIVSILMIITVGLGHILDGGNPYITVISMYGWAIVGVDCLVNIE